MSGNFARQIKIQLLKPSVEYLSLKHETGTRGNPPQMNIAPEFINFLKFGKRIEAIKYLLIQGLEYNLAIDFMIYCENNLNQIVKDMPDCWFDDEIGEMEFEPVQKLFHYVYNQEYSQRGNCTYTLDISCDILNLYKTIRTRNYNELQSKAEDTVRNFAEKWYKEFHKYHETREAKIIENINTEIDNILIDAINRKTPLFDWGYLKKNTKFVSAIPFMEPPSYQKINIDLLQNELEELENNPPQFNHENLSIFAKFIAEINDFFTKEYKIQEWKTKCSRKKLEINESKQKNETNKQNFEKDIAVYKKYQQELQKEKATFLKQQEEENIHIENKKELFKNRDVSTIEEFYTNVLMASVYPILFYKDFSITFNNQNNILLVDYVLPNIEDIYNIKAIEYMLPRDNFKTAYLKPKELNNLFDTVIYGVCLRTIYEIFSTGNMSTETVVFNGYAKGKDKTNGKDKVVCIMSLQVSMQDFKGIDFANIEPQACFRALKGISAIQLSTLTPVRPILQFDKNDKRFVGAYDVMGHVEEGYNLATMNWQDFENLVREVFEKEFSQNGGEVKITQASRDNGVDAIAFDPDPIRGGKIVIQAKRYTNIVGVAHVRDLYGTVMNEGATKGILVTTSDYGAESYEFAKDKPLTLLNGMELLYLLEKHGHRARIDLNEAKEINQQLVSIKYYIEFSGEKPKLHKGNCIWLNKANSTQLGEFSNMDKAIKNAKNKYSDIEICEKCCENSPIYNR